MNRIKGLSVDDPVKISRISSETKLRLGEISGDTPVRLSSVDQGGTREVINYDYDILINKPSIEGNVLIGDKTYDELGLNSLSFSEIEDIINS